ncbi:hypothetical protein BDY24DRAFT_219566 [Mrakia frigida]|uniref:uncharacterized protein n=1 Tax=Mrakia frigida TaxID=29902 RepID=UPI003FCBF20D
MTSVIPSSRILRSSHGKRLQAIPWETLQHIFSYCDQASLFAISLVSFGCWELAGPLLYENVEITSLDGLASLFFIKVVPSSPRLAHTTSLFSRIRTLTLDVNNWKQQRGPYFDSPDVDEEDRDDFDAVALQHPHRLLAFPSSPS